MYKILVIFIIMLAIGFVAKAQEAETTAVDELTSPPETEAERIKREILKEYPRVDLGREVDEAARAKWLFEEEENVREILGLNPRFVYNPKGLPDPMILPWIRQNVIAQELLNEALGYLQEEKLEMAEKTLKKIVDSYPGSSAYARAKTELDKLRERIARLPGKPTGEALVTLPAWIYENTTGIIWEPAKPVVLIGDYTLAVGEVIPKYPEVMVFEIQESQVVFKFKEQLFPLKIEPY